MLMKYLGSNMSLGLKIFTYFVYFTHLGSYTWVVLADPGLATIPLIEFEEPLDRDTAK